MHSIVKMCVASASELKQSDLYMSVKAVLFTTPSANLNGVRCTEGFIDDIIANQDAYVGLPLSADIRSLESGQYDRLGHMFDQRTGTFATAIIGSFYKFEKETLPSGEIALIGYARIMKRNKAVCSAIGELFASGNLKFSFEISCGEYTQLEDGTMLIDASKDNFLEGMCIVWSPACPVAVAKELVAELNNDRKGAEAMHDEEIVNAEVVEIAAEDVENAEVQTEEAEQSVETVNAEEATASEDVAAETADNTIVEAEEAETAEVVEAETQNEEVAETTEENKSESTDESADPTETAEEEQAECKDEEKKVASTEEEMKAIIASLAEKIEQLSQKISELENRPVPGVTELVASVQTDAVHPFMADISVEPKEKKYSLLEVETRSEGYSLLEKA